jgi:hypothetical protein
MSSIKKLFVVLLTLAILIGATGWQAQAATEGCIVFHSVKANETVKSIAKLYGMTWQDLASLNGIGSPYSISAGQQLCVTSLDKSGRVPALKVKATVRDASLAIKASNLPANSQVDIYLASYGTGMTGGTKLASVKTGKTGVIDGYYNFPPALKGVDRLDLRLQIVNSSAYVYRWYWNITSGPDGYSNLPKIVINSILKNTSVTVTVHNLPPNYVFDVLMSKSSDGRSKNYKTGTISSKAGGTVTATFNIPAELRQKTELTLFLQNATLGYYGMQTFPNVTTK